MPDALADRVFRLQLRSAELQMRRNLARSMTFPTAGVACALGLVACAQGANALWLAQLPQWRLADPPIAEVGLGDGVLFGNVEGAAAMADGSVLIRDWQSSEIVRLSPVGDVMEVLGGPGDGPGEFRALRRVFALGDTIVAYDSNLSRVTVWRPGGGAPEIHSLPQLDGSPADLKAVLSSNTWILEENLGVSRDDEAGLKERRSELWFFDVETGDSESMGTRHVAYDFVHHLEFGIASYSVPFLGTAHVASVAGMGLFIGMDDVSLEVWSLERGEPERRVLLPIGRSRYSRDAIRAARDEALSGVSGEHAALVRERFNGVLGDLPPLAPPVQRIVRVGEDAWIQPFATDTGVAEWIVVRPLSASVVATAAVDPSMRLLAGSGDVAVLLGETEGLGEQFVQLRRIVRDPPD